MDQGEKKIDACVQLNSRQFDRLFGEISHVICTGRIKFLSKNMPDPGNRRYWYNCVRRVLSWLPTRLYSYTYLRIIPTRIWKVVDVYCYVNTVQENVEGRVVSLPNHVQDLNGTLYFSKVRSEDKARYTCVASNRQGSINVTIDVDVVGKYG